MITSIVFDVDDTIYDQQAPYRIAMEKCFPDFDMSHMNQAYIRFRHYSDVGFPRVMAGEWTTEYFRFGAVKRRFWSLATVKLMKKRVTISKRFTSMNWRISPCLMKCA